MRRTEQVRRLKDRVARHLLEARGHLVAGPKAAQILGEVPA